MSDFEEIQAPSKGPRKRSLSEEDKSPRQLKLRKLDKDVPTTTVFVPNDNKGFEFCRYLKCDNIVLCYDAYDCVGQDVRKFVFEHIKETLEDMIKRTHRFSLKDTFFRSIDGKVIGMTQRLQTIVLAAISAVIYLRNKKIKHNDIGSLANIVFSSGDVPMLHNFNHASQCDGTDIMSDLRGIVQLVDLIIKACRQTRNHMPLEIRSLLYLLTNFPASMDISVIKSHPALLTASHRTWLVYRMGVKLGLGELQCNKFNEFVLTRCGNPAPSLSRWKATAKREPCLRKRASSAQYVNEPASLAKFVCNTSKHIDEFKERVVYTDDKLADIFLKIFPNFYICWWFHDHGIDYKLFNCNP